MTETYCEEGIGEIWSTNTICFNQSIKSLFAVYTKKSCATKCRNYISLIKNTA